MKRKPKTERQKQVEKADGLARQIVRSRGYCQLAGKDRIRCGGVLQWAHIVGRSNYRLRWELWNALCLCAGHHVYYTHHPLEWFEIVALEFPEEWAQIQQHRNEIKRNDLDEVIKELEETWTSTQQTS